jgi:hypothetical protein
MFSKNNARLPKSEREYFDRPVVYQKEGHYFNPLYKKAFEFSPEGFRNSFKSLKAAGSFRRKTFKSPLPSYRDKRTKTNITSLSGTQRTSGTFDSEDGK